MRKFKDRLAKNTKFAKYLSELASDVRGDRKNNENKDISEVLPLLKYLAKGVKKYDEEKYYQVKELHNFTIDYFRIQFNRI